MFSFHKDTYALILILSDDDPCVQSTSFFRQFVLVEGRGLLVHEHILVAAFCNSELLSFKIDEGS